MRTVLTLIVLLAPALSSAQWIPTGSGAVTRWELTVFGGYRWDGSFDLVETEGASPVLTASLEHDTVWGLALGAPIGADYHLELYTTRQSTLMKGRTNGGAIVVAEKIAVDVTHLALVRTWRQRAALTSHLGFGAGITQLDPAIDGFDRENRVSLSLLGGLKYDLLEHLAARLDGRLLWTVDDDALERTASGVDFPAALDPGRLLQYEVTLGLAARW